MALGGTCFPIRSISGPASSMVAVSRDPRGLWLLSLATGSDERKIRVAVTSNSNSRPAVSIILYTSKLVE
jgi:hypothetical protein